MVRESVKLKQYYDEDHGASKVLLLFVELFVGSFGFDRMYMGDWGFGLMKFMLFFMSLIMIFIFFPVGVFMLVVWAVWALIDAIIVFVNAIAGWRSSVFGPRKWTTPEDVRIARYLGIVVAVIYVIAAVWSGAATGTTSATAASAVSVSKGVARSKAYRISAMKRVGVSA